MFWYCLLNYPNTQGGHYQRNPVSMSLENLAFRNVHADSKLQIPAGDVFFFFSFWGHLQMWLTLLWSDFSVCVFIPTLPLNVAVSLKFLLVSPFFFFLFNKIHLVGQPFFNKLIWSGKGYSSECQPQANYYIWPVNPHTVNLEYWNVPSLYTYIFIFFFYSKTGLLF